MDIKAKSEDISKKINAISEKLGLSEDLYRDGFCDITSCDYSSVVIQKMKDACRDKVGLKCRFFSFFGLISRGCDGYSKYVI